MIRKTECNHYYSDKLDNEENTDKTTIFKLKIHPSRKLTSGIPGGANHCLISIHLEVILEY